MNKTIIHLTDNSLDEELARFCRKILVQEARDIPIVSVSQKPIKLGTNICVGKIGKSWFSLYKQLIAGLEEAKTTTIRIAEVLSIGGILVETSHAITLTFFLVIIIISIVLFAYHKLRPVSKED